MINKKVVGLLLLAHLLMVFSCESKGVVPSEEMTFIRDRGQPKAARLEKALTLLEERRRYKADELLVELLTLAGNLSLPADALAFYEEALAIASQNSMTDSHAIVLNRSGIAYRKLGSFDEALRFHDQAMMTGAGNDSIQSLVLNSRGITLLTKGDFDQATTSLTRANFLNLKHNWIEQAAAVYNNLGVISEKRSAYGESLHNYDKALEIRSTLNDTLEMARIYKNKAIVYNGLGSFDQAVDLLLKSVSFFKSIRSQNPLEEASALNSLGVAYYNLAEYRTCLQYYYESSSIRERIGNLSGLSGSYNNMANAHRALGQLDSAYHYLSASIKLKEQIGRQRLLAVNYKNLAEILIEQKKLAEARLFLDSALVLSEREENRRTRASVLVSEAYYFFKLRKFQEARRVLDKTIRLLGDISSNDLYAEAYDLYRQICFAEGDAARAQYFDAKYDSLDDLIFEKQKLAIVKMEADRDNAELAWMAQQNELAMAVNAHRAGRNRLLIVVLIVVALVLLAAFVLYRKYARKKEEVLTEKASKADALEYKQKAYETGVHSGLVFFKDHLIIRGDSRDKTKASMLSYKDIVLVKTNGDHLYWHTKDGGCISIRLTMNSIEEQLKEHGILRCHRSWAVNKDYVKQCTIGKDGSGIIYLSIPVHALTYSRSHKKRLGRESVKNIPLGKNYSKSFGGP